MQAPLGLPEVEAPRISRQSAHEGGKVVSTTHRPHLPPRRYPRAIVRREVLSYNDPIETRTRELRGL